MRFVGQYALIRELDDIIAHVRSGNNINVLFKAPSGYGKTTLALWAAGRITENENKIGYYIPNSDGVVIPDLKFPVILIDEVHLIKTPEPLYPLMDSGKATFLLCTNESGKLKEPLVNRCISLVFERYSPHQIGCIIQDAARENGLSLSPKSIDLLVSASGLTPRIALGYVKRLGIIAKNRGIDLSPDTIEKVLGLEGGLSPDERAYMQTLSRLGGASQTTLQRLLGFDRETLYGVESLLLQKGLLQITSKGRIPAK